MKIVKKKILGKESRSIMMEGINELADVVGSTYGARGRNVILDNVYGPPLVVNDGVTIANEIFSDDPVKNNAIQLIKGAANKTNAKAGDGTTGSIVLSRAIMQAGWDLVEKGANPVQLQKELTKACNIIEENLKKQADKITSVEQAIQIASVSVQDKELGEKIGRLMFKVGKNGAVAIKPSIDPGVFTEQDDGMRLEGALTGGVVDNPERWESKFGNANILILKDSPEDFEFETKWVPFLKQLLSGQVGPDGKLQVQKINVPQLIVISETLSRKFIMVMNQNKDFIKWAWFRPATAGKNMPEIYDDLKAMIGGEIVHEEKGIFLSRFSISSLGGCESATVTRHELVITVNEKVLKGNDYLDRINAVKGQIENAEDTVEQEQIRERLANLTSGVASIKVSAATEQDTTELKLRIEDAVNATRAAMEEGYVSGGGVALFNAAKPLKQDTDGAKVLAKACEACIRQILYNAGYEDIDKILKELPPDCGIDVLTNKQMNMKEAGIVDPLKVIRMALINAVSVSGLLLTTENIVINIEDEMEAVKKFFTQKD